MSTPDAPEAPDMAVRRSDPTPIVKVTREISLWQLATAGGTAVLFAAAIYYGQQRQGDQLTALAKNVEKVLAAQDDTKQTLQDLKYEVRDTQRRVTALETKKGTP